MITATLPDGTTRVQAWTCTRSDHPGMIVYAQDIAVNKIDEGFDVALLAVDRRPDGSRVYRPGVLVA